MNIKLSNKNLFKEVISEKEVMLNIQKTGLSVGVFVAVWYTIISLGFAFFGNAFWRLIMKLHPIEFNITLSFTWTWFIVGVIVHFISAFLLGMLFAVIWNKIN